MTSIYFETQGEGPDLVLFHGWGFNSEIWQDILPTLQKQFRVTILDLPGFGRSLWNINHYQLSTVCEALLSILPNHAIYLGWSLGGLIATYLAINYPEKVDLLINVCMSPCFLEKKNWPGISADVLNKFIKLAEINPKRLLIEFAKMQLKSDEGNDNNQNLLTEIIFRFDIPENRILINSLMCLYETDLRDEIKTIEIPQYYFFGKHDLIVPINVAENLLDHVHSERIKIIDSGHLPFLNPYYSIINLLDQSLKVALNDHVCGEQK